MTRTILLYLGTAVTMVAIDLVWLGVVARNFYVERMGDLLLPRPDIPVAIGFYLLYAAGLVIFAGYGADRGGGWTSALLWGGLFGLFAYATYDLTNLATMKGFPASVAAVDMAWGTLVSAVSAAAGVAITRAVLGPPA